MGDNPVNDVSDDEITVDNGNVASGITITEADLDFLNTFINKEITVTTDYLAPQEIVVGKFHPDGEEYKIEATTHTSTVETSGTFGQVTRSWDINDIEEILEMASLMEFQTVPVVCPISSCAAYISSSTVLGHMLKCHTIVGCQEIGYRDVATFSVYLNKLKLDEVYCAGILAYCGTDSMGANRPGSGGLCYQNADLPDLFDRIECHLPILIMVCMTTLNALLRLETDGCDESDSNDDDYEGLLSQQESKNVEFNVEADNDSTDSKEDDFLSDYFMEFLAELAGPKEEEQEAEKEQSEQSGNVCHEEESVLDASQSEMKAILDDQPDRVLLVWCSTVETARPVHCLLNVFTEQSTGANVSGMMAHCLKDGTDPRKFSRLQPDWICLGRKEQADLIGGAESTLVSIEAMITSY